MPRRSTTGRGGTGRTSRGGRVVRNDNTRMMREARKTMRAAHNVAKAKRRKTRRSY